MVVVGKEPHMMGWYGGAGWGAWLMMGLFVLGFWALIVFGGLALWRAAKGQSSGGGDARRLLDERFARGEIDEQEYTARRDLLRARR
jgi:putative membrane protein